jgi:hypothetical protein
MKLSFRRVALMAGLLVPALGLQAFDYAGKWGISGFGGFDTLAMGDVNNTLSNWGGSINDGWEAGVGVSYGLSSSVLIDLTGGEIFDQASFNGGSISLPALSFKLGGEYVFLPNALKDFDLSVAGGVEYDMLDGSTSIDPTVITGVKSAGVSASGWGGGGGTPSGTAPSGAQYVVTTCVGQTVGGQLSLRGKYFVTTQCALGLEAGYRYSHIYDVNGTTNGVTSHEAETVDYSGLLSKLTITYYF